MSGVFLIDQLIRRPNGSWNFKTKLGDLNFADDEALLSAKKEQIQEK